MTVLDTILEFPVPVATLEQSMPCWLSEDAGIKSYTEEFALHFPLLAERSKPTHLRHPGINLDRNPTFLISLIHLAVQDIHNVFSTHIQTFRPWDSPRCRRRRLVTYIRQESKKWRFGNDKRSLIWLGDELQLFASVNSFASRTFEFDNKLTDVDKKLGFQAAAAFLAALSEITCFVRTFCVP